MLDRRVLTAGVLLVSGISVGYGIWSAETRAMRTGVLENARNGPGVWSQFRADSDHTGRVGVPGPKTPYLHWSTPRLLMAGSDDEITPALASDGTLFCACTYAVYAVRPDGSIRWTYKFPGLDFASVNSPAVGHGGVVFVPTEKHHSDMDLPLPWQRNEPGLYALDGDGHLLWKYSEAEPATSPLVGGDGLIYLGTHDAVVALTQAGRVVRKWAATCEGFGSIALSRTKRSAWIYYLAASKLYRLGWGGEIRQRTVGTDANPGVGLAVSQKQNAVYVVTYGGLLTQLDPASLATRWHHRLAGEVDSHPAVTDRAVYVGGTDSYGVQGTKEHHHSLYAISHGGKLLWKLALDGELRTAPAVDKRGDIYVTLDSDKERAAYLVCVRPNGTLRWRFKFPPPEGALSSPIIGDRQTVYCYHDQAYAITDRLASAQP